MRETVSSILFSAFKNDQISYFAMLIIQVTVAYNGFPWKNEKRVKNK